ncbi:MAG: bifunctional hydroxymethylpyrimidine kinase/phosphomethylpyrimidine kinase [Deltaproteobacteria bacterium]|jgi:hydroxymethylpyrimidine/phosphomethylpyrimidine kinase|nr:bifunctional hydroxymethylpyrimidine kinase/phosphomethylpyrimidine kinase [Deltaproteobacteria bacterium]
MVVAYPLATALTIASSDSSGGAGIQADLKTFASLGVFGLTVVCAVTAQNTQAVTAMESLSPSLLTAQLEALWADLPVGAIKIGLIGPAAGARAVADFLRAQAQGIAVVLDPVMVSASGHVFLSPEDQEGLKSLFPLATLLTPNLPEAEALTGQAIDSPQRAVAAGEKILKMGPRNVLIKGGHGRGPSCDDYLISPQGVEILAGARIETTNTHGTGCSLSSAIAAWLARGQTLGEAVRAAKAYVAQAFLSAPRLGRGPGPLNHFHQFYGWREPTDDRSNQS